MIIKNLGANPLVIHLPIGSEEMFSGLVDLVKMKALVWGGEVRSWAGAGGAAGGAGAARAPSTPSPQFRCLQDPPLGALARLPVFGPAAHHRHPPPPPQPAGAGRQV
jgi:hypothetical protein